MMKKPIFAFLEVLDCQDQDVRKGSDSFEIKFSSTRITFPIETFVEEIKPGESWMNEFENLDKSILMVFLCVSGLPNITKASTIRQLLFASFWINQIWGNVSLVIGNVYVNSVFWLFWTIKIQTKKTKAKIFQSNFVLQVEKCPLGHRWRKWIKKFWTTMNFNINKKHYSLLFLTISHCGNHRTTHCSRSRFTFFDSFFLGPGESRITDRNWYQRREHN